MIVTELQEVADAVIRRAKRQGFVLPSEIREELEQAHLPKAQWKELVALKQNALSYRQGRYYYQTAARSPVQIERRQQRDVHHAIRKLIREYKKSKARTERRHQNRVDFIQPVKVRLEDQREITLLSRDLSETGIHLIASRGLLGQKVHVLLPCSDESEALDLVVRILWTYAVGDDLYENGGTFLELVPREPQALRLVSE